MSGTKQTGTVNMTEGNIIRQIILFALPLLGSSLVQQLYNTVDLLYVGNAVGKNAAAAVGASSMMIDRSRSALTGKSPAREGDPSHA